MYIQSKELLKKLCLSKESTILDTLKVISSSNKQIALVVDSNNHLLGTVTDGDIRRGLIKGLDTSSAVELVMMKKPASLPVNAKTNDIINLMNEMDYKHVPLTDSEGVVTDLATFKELLTPKYRQHSVVIMAGGLGKRLGDLTKNCPKPMLKLGNKPILELILENFINQQFKQFYFSVNYLSDIIKNHFGDGSDWGVNIHYIEEDQPLGTAGALHLIETSTNNPIIVMNGDLITKVNFKHLLDYHLNSQSDATMCVREYNLQVPYGVVETHNQKIFSLSEKPSQKFNINAGIYVLNPNILNKIPKNEKYDMTKLFEDLIKDSKAVNSFLLKDEWLDIGQLHDLKTAQANVSLLSNNI